MSKKQYTLRVSVRRGYGGGDAVEWSVETDVELGNGLEMRAKFFDMTEHLNTLLDQHEASNTRYSMGGKPVDGGAFHPANDAKGAPAPEITSEPIEKIIIEHNAKGRIVKLAGGRYAKWGVPLYPDRYNELPGVEDKEPGTYSLKGTMTIEKEGGKPKRVIGVKRES